jgi:protein TonB
MTRTLDRASPFSLSIGLHIVLVLFAAGLHFFTLSKSKKVDFEVIEIPPNIPANLNLQPPKEMDRPKPPPKPERREVFGASRKSIQTTDITPDTAEIKAGNTVAKENDNLKLNADDADSIPIPADAYLITSMPAPLSKEYIPYPPEAKKAEIEGSVVMEMIIDDEGRVRQVTVIRGPGYGLDEAAAEAMKKVRFRPGKIGEKNVPVKFRYTYTFKLERM